MFDDLKDKRILVTGASQGIGLAAALAFARMWARVGITSRAFDEHDSLPWLSSRRLAPMPSIFRAI